MLQLWVILALLAAVFPAVKEAEPAVAAQAPAKEGFVLTVDGEEIGWTVEPYYLDGTLYIPLRVTAEALEAEVQWDAGGNRALVSAPGLYMEVPFGECWVEANGRCLYVPAGVQVADGAAAVPASVLAAAFGAQLFEDTEAETAELVSVGGPIESGETFYGEEDLYWLSRIIDAEARGEPFEGKIAVGNVVMNRVFDEGFPDTVKEVIFDRRSGIQFSPAYSGSINRTPSEESIRAAKIALEGESVVEAALYFSPAYRVKTSWAGKNRPFITEIGNHAFFA